VEVKIRRGLDIPIAGSPEQRIHASHPVSAVGVVGYDYIGLKPNILVAEGDRVELGDALFQDRHNSALNVVAPGSGVIESISRGPRRTLQSIRIKLDGDGEKKFKSHDRAALEKLDSAEVEAQLIAAGLWTAFRTRPYSLVPLAGARPQAIFVTAMDTNPLAADPAVIIGERNQEFIDGLIVLTSICKEPVFVCAAPGVDFNVGDIYGVNTVSFAGPHPAGLPGTHIHFLMPVGRRRTVWHIGYQDVIAIGHLFVTGRLSTERVIALAGPVVREPKLIRTRGGADTNELVRNAAQPVESRVISGSILSGRRAAGAIAYIGRYDTQISVLAEGRARQFLGWLAPGRRKYSATNAYISSFLGARNLPLTTSQQGSPRAMVPIGSFERIMPLDILPTQLLRAIVVGDTETAVALGCLELDEQDLALCSFVCPSKYDYGPALRSVLDQVRKETL